MHKQLNDLDLNLLRLLKAVVETRNTHSAADELGVSQASVSRGLAKLRGTFGDQLFIRKAHGMTPSELAEKLAEAYEEMLNPVAKVMDSYQSFDPHEYSGELTIVLNVFLIDTFGDVLLERLSEVLPKAKFKLLYWQENSLTDILSGKADYFLQLSTVTLPQEIYTHALKDVPLRLVARKDHPVLCKGSDWDSVGSLPLARVVIDGINTKRSTIEDIYLDKGFEPNIELTTHSIPVLIKKLKSTDAITYASNYLANSDDGLDSYPLPTLALEHRRIGMCGGYLQTRRGFPLYQYLHQCFQELFDSLNSIDE